MPNYGAGILSVTLLALLAIVGSYWLAYLAHVFLVVLEQTAAGAPTIDWPDEPFIDWLWKGGYLLWITGIWLVPVSLLVHWFELSWVWGGVIFVLFFPVGLLSSLGGSSKLAIVSWSVLARLARLGYRLPLFYILSFPLLASVAFMINSLRFLDGQTWLAVLSPMALVVGLAGLCYAQLIGRLGFLIGRVHLPSDDAVAEEKLPADLAAVAAPPPAPAVLPADDGVFQVTEELLPAPLPAATYDEAPVETDEATTVLPPFWSAGSFRFLKQPGTWGALAWLTAGGTAVGAIVQGLLLLKLG